MVQKPTGEVQTGFRVSTGAHWASASSDKLDDYDIGAGYVYERSEASEASADNMDTKHRPANKPETAEVSQGAYVSVERVLSRSNRDNQRTWLGMRAEYLQGSGENMESSISALARINWEINTHVEGAGAADSNCGGALGFAYGKAGVGFYAEAGARRTLEGAASLVATMGLSMRLPFLGGVAFDLCPN